MFIKLCRIGQNAVTRFTTQGTPVTSISCAYNFGYGDQEKTQWLEADWWGDRGAKLADKLTKGRQILLTADDIHIETFEKGDKTLGAKLKARVVSLEFTSGSNTSSSDQTPASQA
ncbi:single-stranded DNA-binding protein [Shewanella sp.]|uniref:single-stranded DNA-binding protein n=1 Tax=Shewanella sp. TaxID=50422 RepID=UPI003D1429BE